MGFVSLLKSIRNPPALKYFSCCSLNKNQHKRSLIIVTDALVQELKRIQSSNTFSLELLFSETKTRFSVEEVVVSFIVQCME